MSALQPVQPNAVPRLNCPPDWSFGAMTGRSPEMLRLFHPMRHIAAHLRVAAIEGESGTGKLTAARSLHQSGLDPQSPFVPCRASQLCDATQGIALIPARESFPESFRGSLKDAFAALPAIRRSARGTLLITRVDELSLAQQNRLIDLFQWIDHQHILHNLDLIPHRIICLSSRPLRKLAATAALRTDLDNRLTAIRFALPPLRERRDDIPLLADLFTARFSTTHGKPIRGLDPTAFAPLIEHSWPGNVRELESVIHAAALTCPGQWIRLIDLPALKTAPALPQAPSTHTSSAPDDDPNLDRAIMRHIRQVLARADGNKLRAAKLLGISRSTLYRLLDNASAQKAS